MEFNKKSRTNLFPIIYLFLILLVIYSLVIIYFCLMSFEEIKTCYLNSHYSNYLILITGITITKVMISSYLISILFHKWQSKEEKHVVDIPFLLGVFFYLFIIGKLIDLIMALIYINPEISSNIDLINLARFRYIFAVVTVLPLYILGLYLYLYKQNLDKSYQEIRKIIKNNTIAFLSIYFGFWIIILNFLNNLYYIRLVIIAICFIFLVISWIFYRAHRGNILSDINCLVISIGFFIYALSQISLPFIALVLNCFILDAEVISVMIMEILSLISFIIILIGFKTRVSYR